MLLARHIRESSRRHRTCSMGCSWLRVLARKSAEYPFVGMLRAFLRIPLWLLNKQDVKDWDVNEVISYLIKGTSDLCFSDYAREYQSKMIRDGHARNARTYELAYQNLERFIGTTKVMFSHLTSTVITRWISSLSNTARAKEQYPVYVRQIFKQALLDYNDYDGGVIRITTNPWPKVIILCLAGINTVDLYYAEKKYYHDGIIGYERRKTRDARKDNAWFEIRVPDIVKPIMEKYRTTFYE